MRCASSRTAAKLPRRPPESRCRDTPAAARRRGDVVAVGVELARVEMAVRVDPHGVLATGTGGSSYSTPSRRRRCGRSGAARSRSCVTITKLVPSVCDSSSIRSKTVSAVPPSRLPVGSSASTQAGLRHQRARDRHALALAARQLARPMLRAMRRCPRARASHAPRGATPRSVMRRIRSGIATLSSARELRQQMMELVDEAERAVAQIVALALASASVNGLPSSDTRPALGSSSPPSTCSSVLLPEPDAPTMASFSPR